MFVILPAAGMGTRMAAGGASTAAPKQFLEIGGVPVLVRSVRAFLEVPRVDAVCVAVRAQERERVEHFKPPAPRWERRGSLGSPHAGRAQPADRSMSAAARRRGGAPA